MLSRYFDLTEDLSVPDRWELDDPRDETEQAIWIDRFLNGEPVPAPGKLWIPLATPGTPLDFSFLLGGPAPVVSRKVADVLIERARNDVQLFQATIESQDEPYYLVNVAQTVRCINESASRVIERWRAEDGQPEKVGGYRVVRGMRIDPAKVGQAQVFRPWGWTVVLVVSEDVKTAMERAGASGAKFTPV